MTVTGADYHEAVEKIIDYFARRAASSKKDQNAEMDQPAAPKLGLGFECRDIIESYGATFLLGDTPETQAEVSHWLEFSRNLGDAKLSIDARLQILNAHMETRSVFAGKGLAISVADLSMFAAIHDIVTEEMYPDLEQLPHLLRWIDYIQTRDGAAKVFPHIPVNNKARFDPPRPAPQAGKPPPSSSSTDKTSATSKAPKESTSQSAASADTTTVEVTVTKTVVVSVTTDAAPEGQDFVKAAEKKTPDVKPKDKKEKKEKPPAVKKESDSSFSVLDIRVGIVKKVWKHPGADALYVEEIDIGEPNPRQIVSGLAKFLTEEQMLNRRVLVLTNVKAGKVREVVSSGLVLCASNGDHSQCEPVIPPEDAKIGEKVSVAGFDGAPEEILNPKKKQFEKIQPDLMTNANGVACYQEIPFTLSGRHCTSSIVNGTVK